jgi:hypothetical protein
VNIWRSAALAIVLLAPLGCDRASQASANTIPDERFVGAYVAISRVEGDSVRLDSIRAAVLAEQGVTEEQMRAFVDARSGNPLQLAAVWDRIRERLSEIPHTPVPMDGEGENTVADTPVVAPTAPETTSESGPALPPRFREEIGRSLEASNLR